VSTTKVMIIGLDAATLDLVGPWGESGELPFIGQLIREGTSGRLRSTIIPSSLPAWSSFATGKKPGKQGLVSFWREGPRRKYFNSTDLGTATMWDIVGDAISKCIVINVPGTYPPRPINGQLVTGMLTPDTRGSYTYPPELKDAVEEAVPEYRIDYDRERKLGKERLDDIYEVTRKRRDLAVFLKSRCDWDLFVVVFTGTDRILHTFWNERETIGLEFFKEIDRHVADLAGDLDENVQLIVVSDHGFTTCDKVLRMNRWLEKQGYLKTQPMEKHGADTDALGPEQLPRSIRGGSRPGRGGLGSLFKKRKKTIDWTRTRAYCYGGLVAGINIVVAGRDPGGIVQPGDEYEQLRAEIMSKLREFTDPETGQKVFREVVEKEKLWSGKFMNDLPDIVMIAKSEKYLFKTSVNKHRVIRRYVRPRRGEKGYHARDGLIIMKGSRIKRGTTIEADLIDVAPTVVHLLGHAVPRDMDGRVLTEAFTDAFLTSNPVEYCDPIPEQPMPQPEAGSPEWERTIERRLKGLGYM